MHFDESSNPLNFDPNYRIRHFSSCVSIHRSSFRTHDTSNYGQNEILLQNLFEKKKIELRTIFKLKF